MTSKERYDLKRRARVPCARPYDENILLTAFPDFSQNKNFDDGQIRFLVLLYDVISCLLGSSGMESYFFTVRFFKEGAA